MKELFLPPVSEEASNSQDKRSNDNAGSNIGGDRGSPISLDKELERTLNRSLGHV